MSEQIKTSRHVLPAAAAAPDAPVVHVVADRLYQLAALTAGFFLLVTLL
jgi:hypothetical protein